MKSGKDYVARLEAANGWHGCDKKEKYVWEYEFTTALSGFDFQITLCLRIFTARLGASRLSSFQSHRHLYLQGFLEVKERQLQETHAKTQTCNKLRKHHHFDDACPTKLTAHWNASKDTRDECRSITFCSPLQHWVLESTRMLSLVCPHE